MGVGLPGQGLGPITCSSWEITLDGDCKDKERRRTRLCLAFRDSGDTSWQGCISCALQQQGRSPEPAFALPVCELPKMCASDWVQSCTSWDHLTCICHLLLIPDVWQPISKAASQKCSADLTYVNLSHKITRNQWTINFKESIEQAGLVREEKEEPQPHTDFAQWQTHH